MHKIKQKILALFLAALMCIPVTRGFGIEAKAADGGRLAAHTHKICEGSNCETKGCTHSDIEWTEWESGDSMPTDAGNYYLTGDVTISKGWQTPEGVVNLCLNNHTLSCTDTSESGAVIQVLSGTELNICDCSDLWYGKITGSTPNGISFAAKLGGGASSCTMYSGRITGIDYTDPTALTGAAVNITDTSASFYMRGGSIKDNGALGVDTGAGSFYVSGEVDISYNGSSYAAMMKAMSGQLAQAGIDLGDIGEYIDISVLKDANTIHIDGPVVFYNDKTSVFMPSQDMTFCGTFTDGWDANMAGKKPSDYFYSAASAFEVAYENNEAVLRRRIVHSHDMSVECGDEHPVTFDGALSSKDGMLCIDGDELELTEEGGDRVFLLPEGSYYLEEDMAVEYPVEINGEVNICLNGKKLEFNKTSRVIYDIRIHARGTLELCDCSGGGKITGENSFVMDSMGAFSVYGGSVVNVSTSKLLKAVLIENGTINFYGGEILSLNGEAVEVDLIDNDNIVYMSGSPVIRGGDGCADIYFNNKWSRSSEIVNIGAPLTGEPYRVKIEKEGLFTSGWGRHMADAEISEHFICNSKGFFINKNKLGELEFVKYAITKQPSKDNSYTVTVTGEPDSYQWYEVSGDETEVSGQNTASYTGAEAGTYICKITYKDGTVLTSDEVCYPQLVGTIQLSGGRRHVKKYIWSF